MFKGDWIQTFTGKAFYPMSVEPDMIDIRDIAHGLSNICRFSGQCIQFYSVAQHSVYVSRLCDDIDKKHGLLHDASEAYLCDIPRPLKKLPEFAYYREIEHVVQSAIYRKFNLDVEEPKGVKEADNKLLATEKRDLMAPPPHPWHDSGPPASFMILPWSPQKAEQEFLIEFERLMK